MPAFDHMALPVSDIGESTRFFCDVLGFSDDGPAGPGDAFRLIRGNQNFVMYLVPGGPDIRSLHLAFRYDEDEFLERFEAIKASGAPFGDGPASHDNGQGPGREEGAGGDGQVVYFTDPSGHLLEIRTDD